MVIKPVIVAVDVLCSCDRLWMAEVECSARILTSACIWCVLFLQDKSPLKSGELCTHVNDKNKISWLSLANNLLQKLVK